MVSLDFNKCLNIITDSRYAQSVVLHIKSAELIPGNSELTLLFVLQDMQAEKWIAHFILRILSHTGLPGPFKKENKEINQLLIGNMLEISEFHKKHHINNRDLRKKFSNTWWQGKEIIKNCPACSLYNQVPLPAETNPKGT